MDWTLIVMWLGFILAAYSVVGNDVIQTLGTFLSSNEKRPWWLLYIFAATVLLASLIVGYVDADIAHGRLEKYAIPSDLSLWYLLPPLVLLVITRTGVPVSTTFMILTLFSLASIEGGNVGEILANVINPETKLGGMINKSLMGYLIAFSAALVLYLLISFFTERIFMNKPIKPREQSIWTVLQVAATGFLWYQWLTQDLANIYVFLGIGKAKGEGLMIGMPEFVVSCAILLGLLAYIFYMKGGAVQKVVLSKINTTDIRSATIIDFSYGIVMYVFKYNFLGLFEGKLPMSTTWLFIGLLAGRELGVRIITEGKISRNTLKHLAMDLLKIFLGLVVSLIVVIIIKVVGKV